MIDFKIWFSNYFLALFSWSRWVDVDTFSFGSNAYLLQGKINKRSNAKKFRVTGMKNRSGVADIGAIKIERLSGCGLINNNVLFNELK